MTTTQLKDLLTGEGSVLQESGQEACALPFPLPRAAIACCGELTKSYTQEGFHAEGFEGFYMIRTMKKTEKEKNREGKAGSVPPSHPSQPTTVGLHLIPLGGGGLQLGG